MELFKLLGTIAINNSDANQALEETRDKAKNTGKQFGDTANEGEKSGSKLGSAFKKIGSGAVALGKTVAVGLGAAATALGGLTVKALSSAGELEQNMGGSEAVFAEHADKIQAKAKEAFGNMGLSTSDYLATANKMGALFQGAGFGIEESMNLSSDAMQRAADVASIMGIDTASAMEAVAGAAKGNFTMMDNLGVAMNDTAIQNYALEKGINKTTAEMTQQEKIGLAMEMFMEKTAYAAGNYAKENETLAGSLGTAKAALSNFLSGSGTVEDVVSSFSNAADVIVKNIDEMFPKLMTGITQLVQQIVPMIPPLLEKLLPGLINGATGLINGIVSAMPQIIQALMAAIPALIQGITQIVNALIAALPSIMQAFVSALPTLLPAIINGIVSMIVTLCNNFAQIIQPLIDALPDIIISIVEALMNNLPALIKGAIALILGIVRAIPQIIKALIDAIPMIVEMIVTGLLQNLPALLLGVIQIGFEMAKAFFESLASLNDTIPNIFKGIVKAIVNIFTALSDWFKKIWEAIKNTFVNIGNAIKTAISNIFNAIKNTVVNIWNGIKNTISNVVNGIKNTVSNVFNSVKNTVTNIWNNIKNAMTKPIEKARDTIKGIIDKIKGFFSGMKLSFPKIKVPHFSIKPSGWKIGDLLEGSIPKLGIEWYAKAMKQPMVMDQPTVFGYNSASGKLMGGGEAGSEVVSGTNTLMGMIQSAVASENGVLVYYFNKIIEILATYFPQVLSAAGHNIVTEDGTILAYYAPKFDKELGKIKERKDRGR